MQGHTRAGGILCVLAAGAWLAGSSAHAQVLAVATAAAVGPAWRAAGIEPMAALRCE